MPLNQDRLRLILNEELNYYLSRPIDIRKDKRLNIEEFFIKSFTPTMRVLDIGCGNGHNLLENCKFFGVGLGIDNDPEHIQIAQNAKQEMGLENVEFRLLSFPEEADQLGFESFDAILSGLGPATDSLSTIQAALRLLKPDGLFICDDIGEMHMPEANELFGKIPRGNQVIHTAEKIRTWLVESGVEIRLCADYIAKWYYKDIYDWFFAQCSIWKWCGMPLPAAEDPRIELFAEKNTIATGEIETTHHVAFVAGVKKPR